MNRMEQLFVEPNQPVDGQSSAPDDRKTFDALAIAARELEASDFSEFEIAFAHACIFAKLDALQEPEDLAAANSHQEPEDLSAATSDATIERGNKRRLRSALALVAAAALVGYITLPMQAPPDEYQARSAQSIDRAPKPTVHVFCVRNQGDGVRFVGAAESPFGVVRCESTDDLKIAYENPDPQLRFVYVAALGADGDIRWYGPTPTEPEALGVSVTSKPTPIGQTRRLSINHPPGTYDVFAMFSPQPVGLDDFEAVMKRATLDGTATGQVIVRTTFEVRP